LGRDPNGENIYYEHRNSASGGVLDVDANPGCGELTSQPVENIFWPDDKAPSGTYIISVHFFQQCNTIARTPFTVRVLVDGQLQEFAGFVVAQNEIVEVYRFER
jgi:uncharacterized protein YfaP (DUF2135 family)